MPRSITGRAAASGGNSLGLDGTKDLVCTSTIPLLSPIPLILTPLGLDITVQWSLSVDDAAIEIATESLLRQAIAYAESQNLYHRYLYLNYAMQGQDPIASYGPENVEFLRQVSRKYDHGGVFQRLVPGGFKLWREKVRCCS